MPSDMAEYWRDVRADRKRRQPEEAEAHDPSTRPCYDWYLHSGNVHFARDRSTFTSYVPLDATTLRSVAFDQTIGAVGIGYVELQVKVSPRSNEIRTLQLRDVFHIPTAPCNGLSDMEIGIEHDLTVSYGRPYWKMYSSEPEETPFCYGVTDRLFRLERADGLTGSRVRDDTSTLFSISTAVDYDVKMACRELYEAQKQRTSPSNERWPLSEGQVGRVEGALPTMLEPFEGGRVEGKAYGTDTWQNIHCLKQP